MFKAVIEIHNLNEIETVPVKVDEVNQPTILELMVAVQFHVYEWASTNLHKSHSLTIHISEVGE